MASTAYVITVSWAGIFVDCNEAEPNPAGHSPGVAAYALDLEAAVRLWQVSIETLAG
jgi:hypothetical protein